MAGSRGNIVVSLVIGLVCAFFGALCAKALEYYSFFEDMNVVIESPAKDDELSHAQRIVVRGMYEGVPEKENMWIVTSDGESDYIEGPVVFYDDGTWMGNAYPYSDAIELKVVYADEDGDKYIMNRYINGSEEGWLLIYPSSPHVAASIDINVVDSETN